MAMNAPNKNRKARLAVEHIAAALCVKPEDLLSITITPRAVLAETAQRTTGGEVNVLKVEGVDGEDEYEVETYTTAFTWSWDKGAAKPRTGKTVITSSGKPGPKRTDFPLAG